LPVGEAAVAADLDIAGAAVVAPAATTAKKSRRFTSSVCGPRHPPKQLHSRTSGISSAKEGIGGGKRTPTLDQTAGGIAIVEENSRRLTAAGTVRGPTLPSGGC